MEFPQIPSNWLPVKLIEISTLNMGQSPSSSDVNGTGDGIAFFQGKAEFGKLHPTAKKFCKAPKKIAESGDILLSVRAPVGPTNVADQKTAIGRGLAAIRAKQGTVDPAFLLHYFRFLEPWMSQQGTGTTFKAISGAFLKDLDALLPPLAEQKVIAEKLDILLAQVETTKARLERIPQILKRFRQSVLAAAVSGRLTETPEKRFKKTPIQQLAKQQKHSLAIGPFGSNLKVSDYREAGHPLVFVREIRANRFGDNATKFISSKKFDELKAHRVSPGDILITKMGDPPGDIAIYPVDRPEAVITADCIKLSVDCSEYSKSYIAYAMQANEFRRDVFSISAGVAQQKVNLTKFRKLAIPVPEMEEQIEISSKIDQLFAHVDHIEEQVNNALARVNHLTQSILAKAFRGELTEQWRKDNPDLIRGENSAEALLERIKAERANQKPAKGAKRAKRSAKA